MKNNLKNIDISKVKSLKEIYIGKKPISEDNFLNKVRTNIDKAKFEYNLNKILNKLWN